METKSPYEKIVEVKNNNSYAVYKEIEDMFNHSSKSFSEMNNTLNWATTIVIALYIFSSKLDLTIEFNKILFNTNNFAFIALIIVFVLFKLKNIKIENESLSVLEKMCRFTNTLKKIQTETIQSNRVFYEDFKANKNTKLDEIENGMKRFEKIKKRLNLYFKIAMFLFVLNATMMPVYYIVQMFL